MSTSGLVTAVIVQHTITCTLAEQVHVCTMKLRHSSQSSILYSHGLLYMMPGVMQR